MLRVTLAATVAAFLLLTANAVAAPPAWFAEGTDLITAADPQANCAPDAEGKVSCSPGGSPEAHVIYNGVAMWGYCTGLEVPGLPPWYECELRVAHDAVARSTPQHGCIRSTNTMSGDKQRAWFWDLYQPPKAAETAELATLAECIAKTEGAPPAKRPGKLKFRKQGKGLGLNGGAGTNGGTFVERLSVTLPEGVAFAPKRTCSRAVAAALTLRQLRDGRCSILMSGILDDEEHGAWFAIAGPQRKVWLRARQGDKLVGFDTGKLLAARGGYGQTLVAELGQLELNAEVVGIDADGLRSGRSCAGKKLGYRIELVNDAGTLKTRKKAACRGGGNGGGK